MPNNTIPRKTSKEARAHFKEALDTAEQGISTVITRKGQAVAAIVPIRAEELSHRRLPLTVLESTGKGLWGKNSTRTIRRIKDEWEREF